MFKKSIKSLLLITLAFLTVTTWGLTKSNQNSTPFLIGKTGANIRIPNTWLELTGLKSPGIIGIFLKHKKKSFYPNINFFLYPKANSDAKAKVMITRVTSSLPKNKTLNQGTLTINNLTFHTLHSEWYVKQAMHQGWLEAYRYSGYIPRKGTLFITCVFKKSSQTRQEDQQDCQTILQSLAFQSTQDKSQVLKTMRH